MNVEQLSLADYNKIKNIPIVNQDLSASGFTPVANTYYRHTGTTGTYKQGVIYYYDGTEYKALDGAGGGGTTLNKYELSIDVSSLRSRASLLYKIYTEAKGRVTICTYSSNGSVGAFNYIEYTPYRISDSGVRLFYINDNQGSMYIWAASNSYGTCKYDYATIANDKTITNAGISDWTGTIKVIYFNDIEIT